METAEARHPDPKQIERFVRGETSRAENRALVRHLLHGCPQCQKVVRKCWAGGRDNSFQIPDEPTDVFQIWNCDGRLRFQR